MLQLFRTARLLIRWFEPSSGSQTLLEGKQGKDKQGKHKKDNDRTARVAVFCCLVDCPVDWLMDRKGPVIPS
ncbi:hypothetical protein BOBR111200_17560 [Bordetella bronchialis]|uniref:Secreted protein n=1 Tax=Bordetella bronchialis TaxID=463025 RepID=A0ABN4R3M3_9BORD|nr:hypothetical protein BAU06_17585 [Bordetella bronchialis]